MNISKWNFSLLFNG